ncbi:hypothetical protein CRE_01800 [Caenorhabditis remanei]|uniref:Uncharacterized protein n=1 Tax=Caenorhabditis remanei TaxID=31234 RepID=E3LFI9_CAERE|nr:hypothetical protein CRE_01800 [Caenorhabditis remanei]
MSSIDLVIDSSEKEETVTSSENLIRQPEEEEVIPGSSPEGVFPNEDGHIFEPIDHQNNIPPQHIPLQIEDLKHGEEIVEEQGDILVDDGEQQYMNMVHITPEDMYEAGFEFEDLNHLTEEQLNVVIAISQQRQAKQNDNDPIGGDGHTGAHHIIHGMIGNEFDGTGGDGNEYGADDDLQVQMSEASMQIILTHDGGVNITDSKQQNIYISPNEIANLNIDLNNLNNDHVNQLLQIALPSMKQNDDKNHGEAYTRDETPSTSYHHNDQINTEKIARPSSSIIGETVQIRTSDGRLQDAVVKYHRGNSEYKIQFMDGEFAYATIDQMLVPQRGRGDHDGYQVAAPMLIRRRDVGHLTSQKRAASSSEDMCPPLLKRSYQLAPVVDGPHVHTPNFCCPICDKKVFQKEPSYIVIRLPACDSCTREKIIVLDEQNS